MPFAAPVLHGAAELRTGEGERLLAVREVADRLGVSTATVYAIIERGELRHIRVSNAIRIAPADLAAYLGRVTGFRVCRLMAVIESSQSRALVAQVRGSDNETGRTTAGRRCPHEGSAPNVIPPLVYACAKLAAPTTTRERSLVKAVASRVFIVCLEGFAVGFMLVSNTIHDDRVLLHERLRRD
jgi:excisionase family DNA binding protein